MIQAGFARVDVTPALGASISGYFYARYADGVLDPIQLNALAFGNGTDTAIIIACDFIGMVMNKSNEMREAIAARTGVPADHVMLCCLHQHTSIRIGDRGGVKNETTFDDAVYMNVLTRKFADVAQMAVADMSEAEVGTATQNVAEDIAFVRRYWLEDGTVGTNPPSKGPKPVRRCDESDNAVRLIRFKREGKKDIAYVNFSTHPDVISGCKLSADWPGFVRRFVEADEDALCLCVVGCQGDSNHVDFFKPKEARFPAGERYAHSAYMGRTVADTVKQIWDKTVAHTGDTVFGGIEVIYNKTNTEGEEKYDEQKQFYADYAAGKFEKAPHITQLAYAKRIIGLRTSPIYRPVPVTVLGLGDIAFVGFGGEPFTDYTHASHAAAPSKTVFCSCCTNGYEGYLPHARAFTEGGYEASSTFFTPCLEEQCIAAAKEMLKKF
jgi:hypothetical protein